MHKNNKGRISDEKVSSFVPNALASGIGSLPHSEPRQACQLIWELLPDIPFWPQLPKRSPLENMYTQYSEGMPGVCKKEDGGFYIQEEGVDFYNDLERFYQDFLSGNLEPFKISREYANGFYTWIDGKVHLRFATAIKGQITGPISFGLQVTQSDRRSILYNDTLRDVLVKQLIRKAQWQVYLMKQINPRAILFLDEPYLSSFGSAFMNIDRDTVLGVINEIVSTTGCLTGIHCCGNTDWSLVLDTDMDILSFDAFSFMDPLLIYEEPLKRFIERGGIIAWGIVPTNEEGIKKEGIENLLSRLERAWIKLEDLGIPKKTILCQSIITPACGLGTLSVEYATEALRITKHISELIRKKFDLCW